MHLIFSKADLIAAINKIQNIVPAKPAMPILSHVLIEATEQGCSMMGTDLMVGMRVQVPARVLASGAVAVPARAFFALVRELPNQPLELSLQPQGIQLLCGASRFKLHAMPKEGMPALAESHEGLTVTWEERVLREALFQTNFAVSREDPRQIITGLLLEIAKGEAVFLSTDGKKLARKKLPIEILKKEQWKGVLPLKAAEELYKLLGEEGTVSCTFMADRVAFTFRETLLVTKLLSGDYPDLRSVIPDKTPIDLTLNREELMSLLRQIVLFISEQHPSARFVFHEGQLALSSNQSQVGEAQVVMPVEGGACNIQIAFNPVAFLDILKHSTSGEIRLGLIDPYNPGVISEGEGTLFILMPMRLL